MMPSPAINNMESKKIAIIINTLKVGGGAERVAAYVADGLKSRGHKVSFLLFDDSGAKYASSVDSFLVGGRAPSSSFSALLSIFRRGRHIASFCRENSVDTCLGFMEEANFSAVASKLLFGNKAKIVCCLRNNPEKKKTAARFLIKHLYSLADLVVANSSALADIARKRFGLKKVSVVYNPVAYDRISDLSDKPLPEECRAFFVGGKTFLNIGRLTAQKGQDVLIKAFALAVEKEPEAKLAIIGEGGALSELVALSDKLQLKDRVSFLGKQENVFPFLRSSAAFVLSSNWEGMPNAILEALAVGTPVVSTDCPTGPREIIAPQAPGSLPLRTDRGILVEVANEKMLSEAMIESLKMEKKPLLDDRFRPENVLGAWENII
jgi:N-acetylgalactosamine-N,N'-diacetylbacillosaminyl-diphospho-undecaprenol 4-alpha-N-acetylgalactosaminyltransferase